jgi:hypothetical protein
MDLIMVNGQEPQCGIIRKISDTWKEVMNGVISVALESKDNNVKKITNKYKTQEPSFWSAEHSGKFTFV